MWVASSAMFPTPAVGLPAYCWLRVVPAAALVVGLAATLVSRLALVTGAVHQRRYNSQRQERGRGQRETAFFMASLRLAFTSPL